MLSSSSRGMPMPPSSESGSESVSSIWIAWDRFVPVGGAILGDGAEVLIRGF